MYKCELEVHGALIKRYVMVFRGRNLACGCCDSYFSVEVDSADARSSYDKITHNPTKRYAYEVCHIERPEIMCWHTLKERGYVLAEDVFTTLADILVRYGAAPKGTPVQFTFNEFGYNHTRLVMNAGLSESALANLAAESLHQETVFRLWDEFGDVPVDEDDQLTESWLDFEKGVSRFDVWHWFEDSFGYPIAYLNGQTEAQI